jgi:hypothetical protein
MRHPSRPSPAACVAVTINLDDIGALTARGLAVTLAARRALTDLQGLAYRLTPGASRDEVNADLRIHLYGVLAEILGERGLYVDVDIDARAGEVFLTPVGGVPQRAATVRIVPVDERAVA